MPTRKYKQRWSTRVDSELQHITKKLPPLHVQPWMFKLGFVQLANLYLNVAPISVPKDVIMTRIPNIGIFLEPTTELSDPSLQGAAIMWVHGGGRIMGHPKMDVAKITSRLVQETGLPLLSVDYRTAPQHVFPAALNDCVAAYEWLCQQDGVYRIIVAGESAGAGLVAELCQRLYDEHNNNDTPKSLPLPISQVLCYPMLDDRTCLDEEKTQQKHLLWNNKGNRLGWDAYLGKEYAPGDAKLPKYAAAARREDLSGLPPAWIMACSMDLFYDEDIEYAKRLQEAGVKTEVMEVEGGFHGILTWGTTEKPIVRIYDEMTDFIKRNAKAANESER